MCVLSYPAGISLVDAGSMAVFSVACMVLYKYAKRFVKDVDDSTMEVADYTGVLCSCIQSTLHVDSRCGLCWQAAVRNNAAVRAGDVCQVQGQLWHYKGGGWSAVASNEVLAGK
jgi:hypothetical protein